MTNHTDSTIKSVRNPIFYTLFGTFTDSLKSNGVIKGAQYWMWDPSLTGPSSPGWSNYSQDQVGEARPPMLGLGAGLAPQEKSG